MDSMLSRWFVEDQGTINVSATYLLFNILRQTIFAIDSISSVGNEQSRLPLFRNCCDSFFYINIKNSIFLVLNLTNIKKIR